MNVNKQMDMSKLVLTVGVLAVSLMLPELAWAQGGEPGTGFLNRLLAWLTGGFGRTCGLIAIVAVGITWLGGRIHLERAIAVVAGIVVIFGAAAIFDMASAA